MNRDTKTATGIIGTLALGAAVTTAVVSGDEALQPDGSYLVEALIEAQDCERKRCDLGPALRRGFKLCAQARGDAAPARKGCLFRLPAGDYDLNPADDDAEGLRLCRSHVLEGAGSGGWGASTVLWPSRGGVRSAPHHECRRRGEGGGGGWSQLRRMAIRSANRHRTSTTAPPVFGLHMQARMHVEDVWIDGFTVGVAILGDVHEKTPTNANLWSLGRVSVTNSAHAAVLIRGGDSNGGISQLLDVNSNCQFASKWSGVLGRCANLRDSSFLGNTHIATHSATPRESDSGKAHPNYLFDNQSQRVLGLGLYGESDGEQSEVSQWSGVIGGLVDFGGPGLRLQGPIANRLEFRNTLDPQNPVRLILGESNMGGHALAIYASAGAAGWPLALLFDPQTQEWVWRVANSNAYAPIKIGGTHKAPAGLGGLRLSRQR